MNLSLVAQSDGYTKITKELCELLKEYFNKDISIYEFHHAKPSTLVMPELMLDNSSTINFKNMETLSKISAGEENQEKIKSLFEK